MAKQREKRHSTYCLGMSHRPGSKCIGDFSVWCPQPNIIQMDIMGSAFQFTVVASGTGNLLGEASTVSASAFSHLSTTNLSFSHSSSLSPVMSLNALLLTECNPWNFHLKTLHKLQNACSNLTSSYNALYNINMR